MDVVLYDTRESICCQMVRLVLAEKGVEYRKHPIDISATANEQFEPWYVRLNPKGVVPTLQVGDEIITDTLRISPFVNERFEGPELMRGDRAVVEQWMSRVMSLHYGVLLYKDLIDDDGVCATLRARRDHLAAIAERDGAALDLIVRRLEGNARFQAVLADPAQVETHVERARTLVEELDTQLGVHEFVAGASYTLADAFATAALARFEAHGLSDWWDPSTAPNVARFYTAVRRRPSWGQAGVVTQMDYHG